MKTDFVQYTLTRRGSDYIWMQADFPCMNPKEAFLISRVFQVKAEKHPKMRIECEKPMISSELWFVISGKLKLKYTPFWPRSLTFLLLIPHQASLKVIKKFQLEKQTFQS